jgi:serine/threonine protein kinase
MMKRTVTDAPDTVGRYLIERLIAHGGMGSVYLARDPAIDRLVVIKLLRAGFDDDASRERFAREARAAGRLHHPNIVTVFDVGEHDDRPFIAMEYVPGETLAHFIRRRAASRPPQKLLLLEDLCAGLHYAHVAGIIHRDIKPANVMHSHEGLVKILDFGIARSGAPSLTREGEVAGTLNYMSPEQLLGEAVDQRTDIYAVGVVAYELITNHMAFPGSIDTGVLHRILHAEPVPVAALEPGIDPDIAAIIQRAMARDRDARYDDLESMGRDLATVRLRLPGADAEADRDDPQAETRVDSGRAAAAATRPPSSRRSSVLPHRAAAVTQPTARPHAERSPSTKSIVLGAAVIATVAALGAALLVDRSRDTPRQADTAPAANVSTPPVTLPAAAPSPSAPLSPPAAQRSPVSEFPGSKNAAERVASESPSASRPQPRADAVASQPAKQETPALTTATPTLPEPPLITTSPAAPPASSLPPPIEPTPAPPEARHDPPPDPRAAHESAIRETLAHYTQAYQSLNSAAVAALMPSLSAEQLRNLGRDLSNYRRYTVEIRGEQIAINDTTATVTCQVLRSFETKSGVAGSNVVPTTFHLRRNATRWTIERVESTGRD